jgi:hypothetical protein
MKANAAMVDIPSQEISFTKSVQGEGERKHGEENTFLWIDCDFFN